jgi:hypothetical protein
MESNNRSESEFLTALANDDQSEITKLFPDQEFILLEVEEDSDSDETSDDERVTAMIAEVEDFSALIVFTSTVLVETFADQTDLFEGEDDIPSFIMTGRELLEMLPEDTGILFNPESEECFVMSPTVFQSFREDMQD